MILEPSPSAGEPTGRTDLRTIPFAPDLVDGARNAVRTCIRAREGERVVVITDRESQEIGACLLSELDAVGARGEAFVVEDYTPRPISDMPWPILAAVADSAATLYAVKPWPGEVPSRAQVINLATERKIRYGHMVGITPEIMRQGMRADFDRINRLSLRLRARLQQARHLHVTTPAGTDLEVEHDPRAYRWIKTSGLISRDAWGNLPGGEIFTHPHRVSGVWVADGPIGDYFSPKYGDLVETPVVVEIAANRIVKATCVRQEIADELWQYCHSTPNADRIGEVAVGTNLAVSSFTGNLLQDEKIPGFHIAFGEPCGCLTGADWTCRAHVDLLARDCNIWVDGEPIMRGGQFLEAR